MRGDELPQLIPLNLVSRSVQDANLRASDYQKPLPDSTCCDRRPRLTCADTSRRYALVSDVGGCFGWVKGGDDQDDDGPLRCVPGVIRATRSDSRCCVGRAYCATCHGTGEVEAGCPRPLVHHRARQPDPFAQLVIGGSIAGSGRLIVRATKVGRDTQLVRLVEQAQSDKASV